MEAQRELRRKDKLEKELKDAKSLVESKTLELKTFLSYLIEFMLLYN